MHKAWLCCVALGMNMYAHEISRVHYEMGLFVDRLLLYSAQPLHGILFPQPPYEPQHTGVTFFFPYSTSGKSLQTIEKATLKHVQKPLPGIMLSCHPASYETVTIRNDLFPIYQACVIEFHKKDALAKARVYHVDKSQG